MRTSTTLAAACLAAFAPAALAADAAPARFAPEIFFAGRTHSEGAFVDEGGRPTSRFSGDTVGRRERDGATAFDQTIRFDDGTVRRRSFRLVRTGPDSIEATGSEVVGTARGVIAGRSLRLLSTIRTDANPLLDTEFDQTFTASPDGRRVRNVSTVTKLGFVVRRVDETFVLISNGTRRMAR